MCARSRRALPRGVSLLGDLARKIFDANGWRRLGYATESKYAEERVGCSLASLRGRMTLSRRGKQLPGVLDALAKKTIGYEHATLVARVATPTTVDAWIARAQERTTRFLREEVEAVEMMARASGQPEILDLGPPDAETLEATKALRRSVLTGDAFEGKLPDFQMSGGPEPCAEGEGDGDRGPQPPVPSRPSTSRDPKGGKVPTTTRRAGATAPPAGRRPRRPEIYVSR